MHIEEQIKNGFRAAKKLLAELRNPLMARFVARSGITIHGFWISAIPAEMTRCVDTYGYEDKY